MYMAAWVRCLSRQAKTRNGDLELLLTARGRLTIKRRGDRRAYRTRLSSCGIDGEDFAMRKKTLIEADDREQETLISPIFTSLLITLLLILSTRAQTSRQ